MAKVSVDLTWVVNFNFFLIFCGIFSNSKRVSMIFFMIISYG